MSTVPSSARHQPAPESTEWGPGVLWCQVHHEYEPSVCWIEIRDALRSLAEVAAELEEDYGPGLSTEAKRKLRHVHRAFAVPEDET